jgi:PAS domain S-box-containing protein
MYFYFYQIFMILSLVIAIFVITLTWRRRHLPAAPAMIALMVSVFVWTLGFFLESKSLTLDRQLFFNNIGYLGSMAVPPAWFVYSFNYTNSLKFMRGWKIVALCVLPFILTGLIWTNDWHHLMWSNPHLTTSGPFTITSKTYGPLFWVALAHNYVLIAAGSIILLRRLFVGAALYARQAYSIIIAVSLPWLWNIIYVFNLVPLPRKDLTPMMFAISGCAITLGLLRYHLFTTVPFAREFIVRQLRDAVFIFDVRNYLIEANPMAMKIIGADKPVIGKKLDDLQSVSALFTHLTAGSEHEEFTLSIAGENHLFEIELTFLYLNRGEPAGRLVMLHDITERRKSEEQYRLVTENSADIIYKLNIRDSRYTFVTPSVTRVLGYSEKEALSLTVRDIITPESYEKQRSQLDKDVKNGISRNTLDLDAIHKDGHIVPLEVHSSLIRDENGQPWQIIGVARDITARKKMESQLIIQDRLAAIGQLASGVAHELNNPLTGIINFSSLLLKRELPEDIRPDIEAINEEAQRTSYIIKNLLAFTRKQGQEKQPVNVLESIQKVLALRAYGQKVNNITVNVREEPGLPPVLGNSSQLQQVFFNIIVNAEHFMLEAHKKGILAISVTKAGGAVRAAFTDDGPGVSKENMEQIFTPLFTTKAPGTGTGLGLSICQGIINEHGGKIWAESEPGKGASFIIELPAYNKPAVIDEAD